jgi:hypothetical protein
VLASSADRGSDARSDLRNEAANTSADDGFRSLVKNSNQNLPHPIELFHHIARCTKGDEFPR